MRSVCIILYPDKLLLYLQLPGQVYPHLFHVLLELLQLLLVHLDPLAAVGDGGILQQGPKHHAEAEGEVDVKGLHVGDLGQGPGRDDDCHKLLCPLV